MYTAERKESNRKSYVKRFIENKDSRKVYKCECCCFQTVFIGNLYKHNKSVKHLIKTGRMKIEDW